VSRPAPDASDRPRISTPPSGEAEARRTGQSHSLPRASGFESGKIDTQRLAREQSPFAFDLYAARFGGKREVARLAGGFGGKAQTRDGLAAKSRTVERRNSIEPRRGK
jgi:hypothetical protein